MLPQRDTRSHVIGLHHHNCGGTAKGYLSSNLDRQPADIRLAQYGALQRTIGPR